MHACAGEYLSAGLVELSLYQMHHDLAIAPAAN